jgi:hypothetical protein
MSIERRGSVGERVKAIELFSATRIDTLLIMIYHPFRRDEA